MSSLLSNSIILFFFLLFSLINIETNITFPYQEKAQRGDVHITSIAGFLPADPASACIIVFVFFSIKVICYFRRMLHIF
jgi:hypothetical protein